MDFHSSRVHVLKVGGGGRAQGAHATVLYKMASQIQRIILSKI